MLYTTHMTKEQLAEEFVQFLKDIGQAYVEFVTTPYGQLRIHSIPRTTYYYNLRRFEQKGLLKKKPGSKEKSRLVLTEMGRACLKRNPLKQRRTDGLSTLVIFDIPESKHRERNIFRRYLIRQGYTLIQKSVLISPFKISPELKELAQELKITNYITTLSAKINQF